ncbi:MAG: RDD family protein [Candidatus Bathyarchaeota archaeon]|nr:MAG: RDD family protein [Candidatus Bathyarchaeota archaeon]
MTYCSKCGKELPEGAEFCPNCGAAVRSETGLYETAVERIGHDRYLQDHWIKRIIAIVIDSIIVGIATTIVIVAVFFPLFLANPSMFFNWTSFPFAMGLLYVLYFTIAESIYGYTIGKKIVGLKIVTANGGLPSLESAFIRNISKIYWFVLILDVIGGFFTATDPHQKYSDRIAHTTVV